MNSLLKASSALLTALLATVTLASVAQASPSGSPSPASPSNSVKKVTSLLPLDYSISLTDAVSVAPKTGLEVVGYRFNNPGVVGEYYPSAEVGQQEFTDQFKTNFGMLPAISDLVIASGVSSSGKEAVSAKAALPAPIQPKDLLNGISLFTSAASTVGASWDKARRAAASVNTPSPLSKSAVPLAAATDWHPTFSQISLRDNHGDPSTNASISGQYAWTLGNGQNVTAIPDYWGIEFKIALYNEQIKQNDPNGIRVPAPFPSCTASPNVKDQFWAKNYNWKSWSVYKIGATSLKTIGAYADINDLYDECYRQSLSIGVGFPRLIPTAPNGDYQLNFDIYAPKGVVMRNSVGSTVEAKEGYDCTTSPLSSAYNSYNFNPTTDCMGLTQTINFPNGNDDRTFNVLKPDRGAAFPSDHFARVPVYTTTDGLPEYCVYLNRQIWKDSEGNPVPQRACDGN